MKKTFAALMLIALSTPAFAQDVHIKDLNERRQEQQQQMQKSGINIQTIPNPQQGKVMTIQNGIPNQNSSQNLPSQQLQNNADMNGLQRNGNPLPPVGTNPTGN